MRCPACNTENAATATKCTACGTPLARKSRRRGLSEETATPLSSRADAHNRAALRAYRVCVAGLIPGSGLLLGPLAVLLGLLAERRGRNEPGFTAEVQARAAVLIGALIALTNWAGLALLILALRGGSNP
jgi:hypothetical protein